MSRLSLTSPVFKNYGNIPSRYTCDGQNINPPLEISGVDVKAKSLVLIIEDPDVPKNIRRDGIWDHWIKYDISPDIGQIEEGKEVEGKSGKTTAGDLVYHGPCPPDREHRYFFKLFVLDIELGLDEGATKQEVEKAMEGHIIDRVELVGTYQRS
jgi:Raf kinase inhibitor-like YbhB/YbcL family protein